MKRSLLFVLALFTVSAWALPEAPHDALAIGHLKHRSIRPEGYNFEAIVKLSNCSGALVIFSGMPQTAKAVVMTNGHCIQKPGGYLEPGEVWVNRKISRSMRLFDKAMNLYPINATKISYATMTNTDLAFYELDQSYQQIQKQTGIRPLLLDGMRPFEGLEIEIISGYWDRGYSCAIDAFVPVLREAGWSWTDAIRYTAGCDTIGGTSGSPIISKHERRVVGVNNTSNRDGEACTINNPCEVDDQGTVFAQQGLRYGQQTYNVYSCLTPDFRIDTTLPACDLPAPVRR
jgi:V8-like Glu-specific endopeptidase